MRTLFKAFSMTTCIQKITGLAILVIAASACGFHLRSAVQLPEGMHSVYAQGFAPDSRFPAYLSQNLKQSDATLTQNRKEAGVVLNALNEQFNRREVSLSETGKANTYELSYILTYDLQDPAGEVILPQQTITVIRDYFNPQINVIGKSEEEGVIRKEMYQEAVRNLLRNVEVSLRGRLAVP
jgi:LPS-assembly lipoprotein